MATSTREIDFSDFEEFDNNACHALTQAIKSNVLAPSIPYTFLEGIRQNVIERKMGQVSTSDRHMLPPPITPRADCWSS